MGQRITHPIAICFEDASSFIHGEKINPPLGSRLDLLSKLSPDTLNQQHSEPPRF